MSFLGDHLGALAFAKALPADDSFVGHTAADVVNGSATRDDHALLSFVRGERASDSGIGDSEHGGQVDIGQERALFVSLAMQPDATSEQTFRCRNAIQLCLKIVVGP